MMNMIDIRKMTSLSNDARQALTAVFDASCVSLKS